jgi:hypothetical protein
MPARPIAKIRPRNSWTVAYRLQRHDGAERVFELLEYPSRDKRWRSLKLICPGNSVKQTWWLGWNGERLSRSSDYMLLLKHLPEVCHWIHWIMCEEKPVKRSSVLD